MPIRPEDLLTGGALQGAVADSLLRQREEAALLAAGDQVGSYRIVRELGRGGMAVVYLAERADGEYSQQVALKWMQGARLDAEAEALFRRERQALADLRHPHIARLLDGGRSEEGRPWFSMEFIDGLPLDRHAIDAGLSTPQRIALVLQVCDALAFAHGRGFLHRDIKPSNVLVDGEGSARLLDFGIAQVLGQDESPARAAFTPGFASPEQLRGEPLSVRSDVYQLGRLLATTLASTSTERDTVVAQAGIAVTRVASDTRTESVATTPGELPAGLAVDLAAILRRALAADPARRYANVPALADDLRAFLDRRPVAARPQRPAYLLTRWTQRHPLAAALSTLVLLALVAMALGFSQRLRIERDIAQGERDLARQERDAAVLARARAEAITRFLNEDLLDAANPLRRAPGAAEVTVREALQAAEARVETRLSDQPETLMSVLATLATLRYEFGEYEDAARLYERARALADSVHETDPQRLRLLANEGALWLSKQDFVASGERFGALVALGERTFGADDERTLEWQLRLLEARSRQGADPAFRDAFEALAQRADAASGGPNRVAGEARLFIAHSFRAAGQADAGAEAAALAHADLVASVGEDHPSTLKAQAVLALGLAAQGRDDEAATTMRSAYERQRARYGPHGLDSMFLQNEYGFMLVGMSRMREAVPVLTEVVERRAAYGGHASVGLIAPLSNLANAQLRLGELDAALASIERAIAVFEQQASPLPAMGAVIHRSRADVLRELGRFDAAATALDQGDAQAALLTAGDIRALALQGSRARLAFARGERERGRLELDAVIVAMRAQLADSHPVLRVLIEARQAMGEGSEP